MRGDLSKHRVCEPGKPLAALHPYELHGIVDDGMRRHPVEVQQLIDGPEQNGPGPVVDLEGLPKVSADHHFELGRRSQRAVHDLRCKRGIGAFDQGTAKLCVESGRRPGVIAGNSLKHASGDQSGWGYHDAQLTPVPLGGTGIGGSGNPMIR